MKTLHLDPTVAKQLQAPVGHEAEVQHLLDNPQEITHFLDFRVDWAFKYILGHEEILVKLLNDLLPVHVDAVKYLPNEIPVVSEKEKRSVFDVICTNEKTGERFLCEMQRHADSDMDDRLLFYGSSLIQKQIERGAAEYFLHPVYVICIANYFRPHTMGVPADQFFFSYRFTEMSNPSDVLTDKLQFYYLELPRLQKVWDTAETNQERWCYLFGNLSNFATIPQNASGFESVFKVAETGEINDVQLKEYLSAMVTEYDKLVIGKYNREEGRKEGIEIGRAEGKAEERKAIIKALLDSGMSLEEISQRLQIPVEELVS